MSGNRYCHASAVLDGKIYTMGGCGVDVYDPQTDSWHQVASMPQGLHVRAAAAM